MKITQKEMNYVVMLFVKFMPIGIINIAENANIGEEIALKFAAFVS